MRRFSGGLDITDNMYHCHVILLGPEGTPYENGRFKIKIDFPDDYPFSPPHLKFLNKVFHPNVGAESGNICLDILKNEWSPVL